MHDVAVHTSIASVLANQLVTSVYQPIVDLESEEIVGYEALARGPVGTNLESPAALFDAATQAGVHADLDWECRAAALRGAIAAGLGRETCLFVNLAASSFRSEVPLHLAAEIEAAIPQLNVIAEITERDLARDPATLVHQLSELRGLGLGIAIDDLGANPRSLALLPFLEPDVIKLDMGMIESSTSAEFAATAAAVRSDAERRGSMILAEGVESEDHVRRAMVMGATHGQGWFFAHPGPLDQFAHESHAPSTFSEQFPGTHRPIPDTPWSLVEGRADMRRTSKAMLLPMSMTIEQHSLSAPEPPVLLAAFQHARNFSPATARRYADLAEKAVFVGILGEGFDTIEDLAVRRGSVAADHPLAGEWTVVSVGPHYSAALIAKDCGDDGPEPHRRFDYVITHDRDTVIAAATSLLRLIDPERV